jgi:hypothetical protein
MSFHGASPAASFATVLFALRRGADADFGCDDRRGADWTFSAAS